jgi:hypothetical protein
MYRRTSTYELPRNEQFVFTNIAWTNKLRLPIHLANTEPGAYEHFNKLTLTNLIISYEKNKFNLRTFNLQTHFKEHIIFVSWGSPEILVMGCTFQAGISL